MPDQELILSIKTPAELAGAQAAVRELERAKGAAIATGKSVDDLNEKLARAKSVVADYKAANGESLDIQKEIAQANKDVADSVIKVGEADVKAAEESAKGTEKEIVSKHELRHIVNHIAREFPLLGEAAKLAMNPIVALTLLAVETFQKLGEEIKETQELLEASDWEGYARPSE